MKTSMNQPKEISSSNIVPGLVQSGSACSSTASSFSSFKLRQRQLENNQIKHLKLGFYESRLTTSDYDGLCQALHVNKSLTMVEIGLELPRPTLLKILDSVASLPCLQSLVLIGLTDLPRRLFQRLVSKPGLRHLELRHVTIGTRSSDESLLRKRGRRRLSLNANWRGRMTLAKSSSSSSRHLYQKNAMSELVHSFADSIQSLHMVASDFEDEDFIRICEWTEGRSQPLDRLGFTHSNSLSPQALETLLSRASCRRLDLTSTCPSFVQ